MQDAPPKLFSGDPTKDPDLGSFALEGRPFCRGFVILPGRGLHDHFAAHALNSANRYADLALRTDAEELKLPGANKATDRTERDLEVGGNFLQCEIGFNHVVIADDGKTYSKLFIHCHYGAGRRQQYTPSADFFYSDLEP